MGIHRFARRPLSIAAIVSITLLGSSAACCAAGTSQSLADSPEWNQLAHLWQTLLDHSSNQVYNPTLFQSLATDLNATEQQFSVLSDRGALPKPLAEYLRGLFDIRYQYLAQVQYTTRSGVSSSPLEASYNAARWVIELQLSLLRKPSVTKADKELVKAAESNIAYQLAYLYHYDRLADEVDRRRAELKKKEDAGEKVDYKAFDSDAERRQNRLFEAYKSHKLSRVSIVDQAMPYILDLTRCEVSPSQTPTGP